MSTMGRDESGTYVPIEPLGWQGSGIDWEVTTKRWDRDSRKMVPARPMNAQAYDEDVLVAAVEARTRIGLWLRMIRAARRIQ